MVDGSAGTPGLCSMMRETPGPECLHKQVLGPVQFDLGFLATIPAPSSFIKHENIVGGLLRACYRSK